MKLIHTNQYGDKFYVEEYKYKVELVDGSIGVGDNFVAALIHAYREQELRLYGCVRRSKLNFLRN